MAFTDDLKAALPDDVTEVVALTVAATTGNDYERHQHERLCLSLGFDEGWVRGVLACDPANPGSALDAAQRAVQALTLGLLADHGRGVAEPLARLVHEGGQQVAVGVLLLVGRYQAHALVVNALELAPPVPSPLEAPA
jgi:alkylhydroperoxidase family enzyme